MKLRLLFDVGRAYPTPSRLKAAAGSWLAYRRSLLRGKAWQPLYPPVLMVEPTNLCNLRCPLCPSGNGNLKRPRGMMGMALFRQLINEVYRQIGMLILWNQGEPFLHPGIWQMINTAVQRDMYVLTSTNFSMPIDLQRILDSGLHHLIVSMDGISGATYDQYRVNGDFELVMRNMRDLVQLRGRRRHPYVIWQFIVMKHNEHEVAEVKRLAKAIGVDRLEFKTAQIYHPEDMPRFLPQDGSFSRYHIENGEYRIKAELLNRCHRLWMQPVVNWDGELAVCCYDKDLSLPIGNVRDKGFGALWFGDRINAIRQQILSDRKVYPICRNCGEGINRRV